MSLRVEINYADGIPQTAVAGFAPRGFSLHWTAGGTGRDGALGTIRHFQATRYEINASYHILAWWDAAASVTGAMWIVPPGKASHSMAPAQAYLPKTGSAIEKARFAAVRLILGPKAHDPNAGCISISFCGMPADQDRALESPVFVADLIQLVSEVSEIPSIVAEPLFGHGWIQPTSRYDPGEELIPLLYREDDMPKFSDVDEDHRFYADIEWLAAEGLTSGVAGTDEYRPEGFVTRGQQAAFMRRLARYIEDRARARQP